MKSSHTPEAKNGSVDRPAISKSRFECAQRDRRGVLFISLRPCKHLAVNAVTWVAASVVGLLPTSRPTTIRRLVIAVYVDAIYRMASRRARPHVGSKVFKNEPAVTDFDAAPAVLRIIPRCRVETPFLDAVPYVQDLLVGKRMRPVVMTASTRFDYAPAQLVAPMNSLLATSAEAQPLPMSSALNHSQMTRSFANHVNKPRRWAHHAASSGIFMPHSDGGADFPMEASAAFNTT